MEATQRPSWKATPADGPLARLAHFAARHRRAVIGVWIVLTMFGGVAAGKLSSRWYQSFSIPGKPAYEASQRALKTFGVGVRAPNVFVFHTNGNAAESVAIERAMRRAAATMPGALTSSYSRRTTRCTSRATDTRRFSRCIRRARRTSVRRAARTACAPPRPPGFPRGSP